MLVLASSLPVAASSARTGYAVLLWMVLGGIGHLLLLPFKRRIGGIDPRTGRPGGSEKDIVGVTWFIAALVTGIYMSR